MLKNGLDRRNPVRLASYCHIKGHADSMDRCSFRKIQMSHKIVARSGTRLLLSIMRFALAALWLAGSVVTARAQTTSATVVGTLTHSSGARIAGGTVTIKDIATGIEHSAKPTPAQQPVAGPGGETKNSSLPELLVLHHV
jgi:hypothetical protein